jgi:hypothetical protein
MIYNSSTATPWLIHPLLQFTSCFIGSRSCTKSLLLCCRTPITMAGRSIFFPPTQPCQHALSRPLCLQSSLQRGDPTYEGPSRNICSKLYILLRTLNSRLSINPTCLMYEIHIVVYRPAAKRRLYKQRPLLGNGSINTFPLLDSRF